jgi:bifunctional non-homologous end joining protein LigD
MAGVPVMLASAPSGSPESVIKELQGTGKWWFEIKFDGIRAIVTRTADGEVTITNRRQVDITHRYPDVVERMSSTSFVGVVDGEIVCFTGGRPDFEKAHRRDAQSTLSKIRRLAIQIPAVFIPFDVLQVGAKDVRGETYTARRMRLATVFAGASDIWSLSSQDGLTMWTAVEQFQLEGLVAKLGASAYTPGRSPLWQKIKAKQRISVLVSGYTAGKGSRGEIGALTLALWDPAARSLRSVGRVGSGMSVSDQALVLARLKASQPVVVDVEYLEVSSAGQLRNPVFKGVRMDISPSECVVATLGL